MAIKLIYESAYVRRIEVNDINSGLSLIHLRSGMADIVLPLSTLVKDPEAPLDVVGLKKRRFTVTIEEGG